MFLPRQFAVGARDRDYTKQAAEFCDDRDGRQEFLQEIASRTGYDA
jgi:hypothetical protein